MSRPRGFSDWRPQRRARELLDAVDVILDEYADHLPLTLRQVFYRLVATSVLDKSERDYRRLCETMNRARRARLVDFDVIRDDGVTVVGAGAFGDLDEIEEYLADLADRLPIDRQRGQERRVQVWCEASGMVPQVRRVAARYGVPVASSGGFDSVTVKHAAARELAAYPTSVLHVGDHDPSGVHVYQSLAEDVRAFVEAFGGAVEFCRLAVTPEQIEELRLPSAPPKATDRRAFEGRAVQAEAIDPATLASIVDEAIRSRLDQDAFRAALEYEQQCREAIRERFG
ncbi:hypothetical protein [Lentisalinibacter salinarum]|uniref:hypothetical protein n=1 Tax=Lentisalinibacter salinarum TaxID=2992239 RepID=UPI003868FF33